MHVLMIPSWYPAGPGDIAGSFFREQAETLAAAGYRVGVLAPRLVSLTDLGRARPRSGVAWTREADLVVGRLDLVQWVPRARTLEAGLVGGRLGSVNRALAAYVERFGRPDVLHAQSLYPGGYLAGVLSRRWGIAWVLTEHRSLDHLRVLTHAGARREAAVVSGAAVRCGVSRGHADHLARRFGPAGGPWEVLHDLVPDPGRASHAPRPDGPPVVGHLSNLAPVKRPDLVVDAFVRARRDLPGARLAIAGPLEGEAGRRIRDLVGASGGRDSIDLLGVLPRADVPSFLARLDALLMPSDSETFGVAAAEALAQGTPVVATRTWGSADVVGPGDGILIGPRGDRGDGVVSAGLASALVDVLTSHEGGVADREARRDRALHRFGPEAFVARSDEVYREALR